MDGQQASCLDGVWPHQSESSNYHAVPADSLKKSLDDYIAADLDELQKTEKLSGEIKKEVLTKVIIQSKKLFDSGGLQESRYV